MFEYWIRRVKKKRPNITSQSDAIFVAFYIIEIDLIMLLNIWIIFWIFLSASVIRSISHQPNQFLFEYFTLSPFIICLLYLVLGLNVWKLFLNVSNVGPSKHLKCHYKQKWLFIYLCNEYKYLPNVISIKISAFFSIPIHSLTYRYWFQNWSNAMTLANRNMKTTKKKKKIKIPFEPEAIGEFFTFYIFHLLCRWPMWISKQ